MTSRTTEAALELACRCYEAGDLAGAESACLGVIRKAPRNVSALQLIGAIRLLNGDAQSAAAHFAKALRQTPGSFSLLMSLGEAQARLGDTDEALQSYRRAASLKPDAVDAHFNIAALLAACGRDDEAVRAYEALLARCPHYHDGHINLGILYEQLGRTHDAIDSYRKALAINGQSVHALANLGKALRSAHDLEAAKAACLEALRLRPDFSDAIVNLAAAVAEEGDAHAALDEYGKALALAPSSADVRLACAVLRLATGDFAAGWRDYAARPTRLRADGAGLKLDTILPPGLDGRRVLLLGEQGIGDELFFLRFAPEVKARGARVHVQCDAKLLTLLERAGLFDGVVVPGEPLPGADHTVAVGDLPLLLGHQGPAVPAAVPLAPLPARIERTLSELARLGPPPYIGLTWRAGTAPNLQRGRADRALYKSVPLDALAAALAAAPGSLLALQRAPYPGEIDALGETLGRRVHDLSSGNDDLEEMLALLHALDEYVGVSNSNMHLMAGLGKAARVLVPNPPEWRWMWGGERSPWFPNFPIYRETAAAGWQQASAALAGDLMQRQPRE